MTEEEKEQGKKFMETMNKVFEKKKPERWDFLYYLICIPFFFFWVVPLFAFVFLVQGVDWVLTKCHIKKPEPIIHHHYFMIYEIKTDEEMFRNADKAIVEAEEARMIKEYGKEEYSKKFHIAEIRACGHHPSTIVQKLTHGALSLMRGEY